MLSSLCGQASHVPEQIYLLCKLCSREAWQTTGLRNAFPQRPAGVRSLLPGAQEAVTSGPCLDISFQSPGMPQIVGCNFIYFSCILIDQFFLKKIFKKTT